MSLEKVSIFSATSGVTELSMTDIFTASYDIYQITIHNIKNNTSGAGIDARLLDTTGSELSGAYYDYSKQLTLDYATEISTVTTNSNYMDRFYDLFSYTNAGDGKAQFWVFNPYSSSNFTMMIGNSVINNTTPNGYHNAQMVSYKQNVSAGGLKLYLDNVTSRSINTLQVEVYGLVIT